MTNETPDAALLWARDCVTRREPNAANAMAIMKGKRDNEWAVTVRAEAFRAGQARGRAERDALVSLAEGDLDYTCDACRQPEHFNTCRCSPASTKGQSND